MTNKEPFYRRGKYKPRTKPREREEGSINWFIERGFSQYQARKLNKQYRLNKLN